MVAECDIVVAISAEQSPVAGVACTLCSSWGRRPSGDDRTRHAEPSLPTKVHQTKSLFNFMINSSSAVAVS